MSERIRRGTHTLERNHVSFESVNTKKEEALSTKERIQNALESFGEDIMYFNGREPGPSVLLLGGVHGNEATGILVVDAVRKALESGEINIQRGSVRIALGNTGAIKAGTRWIEGRDLNRRFTEAVLGGEGEDTYEARRARTLAEVIKTSNVTVDIHATNRPSEPFVCSKVDEEHERMYRWFARDAVLEDPCFVLSGAPSCVDEHADLTGNVGICIESGQAEDVSKVGSVLGSVYALMHDLAMLEKAPENMPAPTEAPVFTMTKAIILDERGFRFAPHKKVASFELFKEGEILGYQGSDAVVAEYDGVFIFPKAPEHHVLGSPVCYLAVLKTGREENIP